MKRTLKEYKKLVLQELLKRINKNDAFLAMQNYEDDFPEFFKKELGVVAAATAIIMGY